MFATAEAAVREIVAASTSLDIVVVDCRHVTEVDAAAGTLLLALFTSLRMAGKRVFLADLRRHKDLARSLEEHLSGSDGPGEFRTLSNLDLALEHAEGRLLAGSTRASAEVALSEHDLLRGLSPGASASVQERLRFQSFRRGEMLVRQGDPAGDIYLITKGEVSVVLELTGGQVKRLSTLTAGMTFGELGAIGGTVRTADVRADTAVECYVLPRAAFEGLAETNPAARLGLLENMLRNVSTLAMTLTREVAALEE
jgi:glutaminase